MSNAGPVTILAADLLGPEDLFRRWRDAATSTGGRRLHNASDEFALAFRDVPAALSYAKRLQRGDDEDGGAEPGARVGIDVGDERAQSDSPQNVAAGLCARAERGQVLVSDAAHTLAIGRPEYEFREVGTLELDRLHDAVRAWELLWRELEPRTRIRLSGPFALEIDGRELASAAPGQTGTLLRYLSANRDRGADRDELIDVLWPARPPKDPHADLRVVLSRLRRALAPATIEGRERLRLALPAPVWVDVDVASRSLEAARAAAKNGLWERTRTQAQAALELLEAGFLPDDHGEWSEQRRRQLEELELEALEWVARSSLALGGPDLRAAGHASRTLIERSPYRETGHRFLMEALAASGDVAEALRVYDQLRVLLRDELGATPAPEVQQLHKRLLAGERARPHSRADPGTAELPRRVPLPAVLSPRERSEFVGRDPELGVLRTLWEEARSGRRRLVLVSGEPGVGKTRLTSEFALEAHEQGTVLYAGCQEEALISYQPFVEALRHYARHTGLDWNSVALGPGTAELARLIPEVEAALPSERGQASDPETRRYLLFEAVSLFLSGASARTPIMLVLDDLHWADRATIHLLRHIIRAPHEAALLIVGTCREAELGAGHPLAELLVDLRRDRLLQRVPLEGLSENDVGTLIASHAGHEASSGLVETVYEQTEGNPFFVEEVMRHLIESGVLFERGGRWMSARTLDEIGVPAGVKEVLAARLRRLSEACRVALSHAAVLGRAFSLDVLRSMVESDDSSLIGALEEALEAQLVLEARGSSEPAYVFTHALVRETLYSGLSGARRQQLHARAATAIERARGEGDIASLAVHHRLAGSAGDAVKAIQYSVRAGADARELSAWEEAAAHWEGALAVMTRIGAPDAERARLLVALADVMVVIGDLERQIAYLEQALALYETLDDEEHAAQVHSRLGMAISEGGDLQRPEELYRAAEKLGEVGTALLAHQRRIWLDLLRGTAMAHAAGPLEASIAEAERLGEEAILAEGFIRLGVLASWLGDNERAERLLRRSLEHAQSLRDPRLESDALHWMLLVLLWGPTPVPEALAECRRLRQSAEPGQRAHSDVIIVEGTLLALTGDFEDGRELAAAGRRELLELGQKVQYAAIAQPAAIIELLAGEGPAAERILREAHEILTAAGERGYLSTVSALLGLSLARQGRHAEADRYADESRRIGADDDVITQMYWRIVKARVAGAAGERGEARRLAGEIMELTKATDDCFNGPIAVLEVVDFLGPNARRAALEQALAETNSKGNAVSAEDIRAKLAALP